MKLLKFVSLVALSIAITGCTANKPAAPQAQYQTVGKDPRRDSDTARAENVKAVDAIEKGDYTAAETHLKSALTADIMFGPAHNNLGKVYYHQNKLYLAAWEFEYAAKVMPFQAEPKSNMGLVFEAAGKLDQAVTQYTEALKLEPENPELIGNDVRARIRRGDNDAEVHRLLEKVVMLDTRPEWVDWARKHLAITPPPATTPLVK